MRALRSLTFNEKLAGALLLLFGPVYLFAAVSVGPDSVQTGQEFSAFLLWHVSWVVIAFVAFCAAFATIFLKPAIHSSNLRKLLGRILPLFGMMLGVFLSAVGMDTISNQQKRAFAELHVTELSGPPPRSVIYRQGVPDGGIAIVRSPGDNPEDFAQGLMLDLTGERIKSCEPITEVDWSCYFD